MNLPEKEFSQLSNEDAMERLMSILPEDEKAELDQYNVFYFDRRGEGNWEISEDNPKVWLLRGNCVVSNASRSQRERVGIFTVWENQRMALRRREAFGSQVVMTWAIR